MRKGRLEAFSDGVIAIIITIMVLELKVPHEHDLAGLLPLVPTLITYVISFVFIGIYWNNHHHLFQAVERVNGAVLWANMHLLFWLSLTPFVASWLGETWLSAWPAACYGVVCNMAGLAYYILTRALVRIHNNDSALVKALGSDVKGRLSLVIYAISIPGAFASPFISLACFVAVAAMWLIPDRRIEKLPLNGAE